jgi:predicted aminopeptidase
LQIPLALIIAVLLSSGCTGLGYYGQAVRGHLALMQAREPVAELLRNPELDPELRARLEQSQGMRSFAIHELGLPDNSSYRSYVALDRPYVVWNVFAAPALSLEPERWCFPVAGCVAYRGYFAEADARAYAAELQAEGLDVFVGGAIAYSTLGWFDDPLLSSMLERGELALAGLIFHELAHQRLYVEDDTAFNEAFASAVEQVGVRRWLLREAPERSADYAAFLARRMQFEQLLAETRARLAAIYANPALDAAAKHAAKAAELDALGGRYAALRASWDGWPGYDAWFAEPVNNARLAAIALYRAQVPDFERWLAACGGDLERFYAAVDALAELDAPQRAARLRGAARC